MLGLGKRKDEASRLDSSHFIYEKSLVPSKNRSETKKASGIWTQAAQTECRRSTACATTTVFPRVLTCKTTVWLTTHKMKKTPHGVKNVKNGFTTKHFLLKMHRPKYFLSHHLGWEKRFKRRKKDLVTLETVSDLGDLLIGAAPTTNGHYYYSRVCWRLRPSRHDWQQTVHLERCWAITELRRLQ